MSTDSITSQLSKYFLGTCASGAAGIAAPLISLDLIRRIFPPTGRETHTGYVVGTVIVLQGLEYAGEASGMFTNPLFFSAYKVGLSITGIIFTANLGRAQNERGAYSNPFTREPYERAINCSGKLYITLNAVRKLLTIASPLGMALQNPIVNKIWDVAAQNMSLTAARDIARQASSFSASLAKGCSWTCSCLSYLIRTAVSTQPQYTQRDLNV